MSRLNLLLQFLVNFSRTLATSGKGLALVGVILAGLMSSSARADVLLYEPFDYPDNADLYGQTGGTGFGGAWTDINDSGNIQGGFIDSTGLSYTDGAGNQLVTSGGHYGHIFGGGGVYRKIDVDGLATSNPGIIFEDTTNLTPGNHIGKDGSTVWMSFIYQSPGLANAGGSNWGGMSFADGDEDDDGSVDGRGVAGNPGGNEFGFSLPPDPTLDPEDGRFGVNRMLRKFDLRGDMGGEKRGPEGGTVNRFSLSAHRGSVANVAEGGPDPVVSADPPTLVLLRFDFQGDPTDPNQTAINEFGTTNEVVGVNEYYETWPKEESADQVRMWLNPSLSSEPALGTEALLFDYESEDSVFTYVPPGDDPNPLDAAKEHYYADRFDFKFDRISMNARNDDAVYDEIRLGTTFGDVAPIVGGGPDVDLDDDGDVDGADFLAIQRTDPSLIPAWEAAYGGSPLAAAVGVPEPTTLALAFLSLLGLAAKRK